MVDDKTNRDGNQAPTDWDKPRPIFESVPVEPNQPNNQQNQLVDNMQPEEIPDAIETPEDAVESSPPPPPDIPPEPPFPVYEDSKMKYFIIGGAGIFFVIIFLLLLSLLFSGKKAANATLTYWGLWEDKQVMDPIIADYQKQNPGIKINYQTMSPQDYRDKLIARSKTGQGPDIFRFHNTWIPEIKDVVAPVPLSVMSVAEFEKTFYPVHKADLKVGNYYYGIPLEIDGLVLIYNDGMFKKAGIVQPPTTWDDVINVVSKLSIKDQNGQLITSGIAMGTADNIEHFSDILGLLLLQNGADLKNVSALEAQQALEVYRKFGEPPTDFWNDSMPNSIAAFSQEKVAMIIAPSWEILSIKAANPDLAIKVVPVPTVPGSKPISLASYWVEGVSKYSKNQLEAWKFVKYLSQKDTMTKMFTLQSKTRAFGEPYSRVDLADTLAKNEYLGAVISQAGNMYSLPVVSRTYDNGLNDEIVTYLKNAVNATTQGVSYAEALQTAQQGINQVLTRFSLTTPSK